MSTKPLLYTQKTLAALRDQGCTCGIVERFNRYAGPFGVRQDLFGIIDIIALSPGQIIGVQSTGQHGHAEHGKTILENENTPAWLRAGGSLQLWSWKKVPKNPGSKMLVWTPRIEYITLEMYESYHNAQRTAREGTEGAGGSAHEGGPSPDGGRRIVAGLKRGRVESEET